MVIFHSECAAQKKDNYDEEMMNWVLEFLLPLFRVGLLENDQELRGPQIHHVWKVRNTEREREIICCES